MSAISCWDDVQKSWFALEKPNRLYRNQEAVCASKRNSTKKYSKGNIKGKTKEEILKTMWISQEINARSNKKGKAGIVKQKCRK